MGHKGKSKRDRASLTSSFSPFCFTLSLSSSLFPFFYFTCSSFSCCILDQLLSAQESWKGDCEGRKFRGEQHLPNTWSGLRFLSQPALR